MSRARYDYLLDREEELLVANSVFVAPASSPGLKGRSDEDRTFPAQFAMVHELTDAIVGDRVQVDFQPQRRLSNRTVHGGRTLTSCTDSGFGGVSVDRFIPPAGASGLIG
jgi:hypothetical protein